MRLRDEVYLVKKNLMDPTRLYHTQLYFKAKISNEPKKAKLYTDLAALQYGNEKINSLETALAINENCAPAYMAYFYLNIESKDYEAARNCLDKYKQILVDTRWPVNTSLYEILIDDLRGVEADEYIVNDYFMTTRLKPGEFEDYKLLVELISEFDYETAYYQALYMKESYINIFFEYVIDLLEDILTREKGFELIKK